LNLLTKFKGFFTSGVTNGDTVLANRFPSLVKNGRSTYYFRQYHALRDQRLPLGTKDFQRAETQVPN
jgi:hypothetical protein